MGPLALSDVCELITDGTHYTPPDIGVGVPFLTVKDIDERGALDFEGCAKISNHEYTRAANGNSAPLVGDVLFSKDGTVGKVSVVRQQKAFAVLSSIAILRPNKSLIDPCFLGRAMQSPNVLDQALRKKTGSAIRRIILSDLKSVRLTVPSLPEQRRIVDLLDKADALRAKRREVIAKLDHLQQSMLLEMVGDPATNPKGWPKVSFGELIRVKSGNGLVALNMKVGGTHAVYGGNGISGYHDAYMFDDPQIVIGRVGAYCGAVHRTKPRSWVTDNALFVSEVRQPVNPTFLQAILSLANFNQYAGRAAQPLVSGSRIYPVETVLPPLKVQNAYSDKVGAIASQKDLANAHQASLDSLFALLQKRAFAGDAS